MIGKATNQETELQQYFYSLFQVRETLIGNISQFSSPSKRAQTSAITGVQEIIGNIEKLVDSQNLSVQTVNHKVQVLINGIMELSKHILDIVQHLENAEIKNHSLQFEMPVDFSSFDSIFNKLLNEVPDIPELEIKNPQVKREEIKTHFSPEIKTILRTWLQNNASHPFPSRNEKEILCQKTGLNIRQINNWFINARRRYII